MASHVTHTANEIQWREQGMSGANCVECLELMESQWAAISTAGAGLIQQQAVPARTALRIGVTIRVAKT
jgi:hypothetical protein